MAQYWNQQQGYVQQPQNFGQMYPPSQSTAIGAGYYTQNQISIVPINGRATAEDYPVAPGAKVILIDPNELVTYVKERDPQGRAMSFAIYDWTIREEPKQEPAMAQPIDYDRIRAMISEEVNAVFNNRQQRQNKKEAK